MGKSREPGTSRKVETPPAETPAPAPSPLDIQSLAPHPPRKRGSGNYQAIATPIPATEPAGPSPSPGTRVHDCELIRLIGRGSAGSVYLARDTRLGRLVAIKFLRSRSPEQTERLLAGARNAAACTHENIAAIYEVDTWQGAPFMACEYLEGRPLARLMADDEPLPPPRAVELIEPVLRALAHAHRQGLVHLNLTPDNVLLMDSGQTRVLDFGLGAALQGGGQEPVLRREAVSPYLAPEQLLGPADGRADVWAIGAMLFKMLSGKHAPETQGAAPVPGFLSRLVGVPVGLEDLISRCLREEKEERWPDAASLLQAIEPYLPGRSVRAEGQEDGPWLGLASFEERDADRFFGRRLEVTALVNRVAERPLIGLVGPSGTGKSSIVRAGLLPALARGGEAWELIALRPGRSPLAALAAVLAPLLSTGGSAAEQQAQRTNLVQRFIAEPGAAGLILRTRAQREGRHILLFVDRFEELYALVPDDNERRAFTACLGAVADDAGSPLRVVISLRSDFLNRAQEDARFLAALSPGLFFFSAPGPEGLREALERPARQAGYDFETPAIVDDMLRHLVTTPHALPLLQFTAWRLWETRDTGRRLLTRTAYDSMGGVAGALTRSADGVISRLPPASTPLVRAIFLRLATPEGTRAPRTLEELRELPGAATEVQALVEELTRGGLLVTRGSGSSATVEIVHETLLTAWPMLRRWFEESAEDSAFREQLRIAARQWQQKGKPASLLWRGELSDEALRFQRRHRGELSDAQRDFLTTVVHRAERQGRLRLAAVVTGVVLLAALAIGSVGVALRFRAANQEATRQLELTRAVVAEADAERAAAEARERARAAREAEAEKKATELREKQQEILKALAAAREAEDAAQATVKKTVRNASEAAEARKRAEEARARGEAARKELIDLYGKEKPPAKRPDEKVDSPVIDTLK